MNFFLAALTLATLFVSSSGFGFAVMKWCIRNGTHDFSLWAAAGIASLIVLGGLLNLAGLAYPVSLYALLALGVMLFALSFSGRFKIPAQPGNTSFLKDGIKNVSRLDGLLPLLLVAIAVIFLAVTLLPSDAFNYHDDFHTYIPRTLRMLQVGTLAGNPYELLGLDSLGAHAFLQGFILISLPVQYLPGFDAVFGLGLAGLLLVSTARRLNLGWAYTVPAILTLLVINPQSVNVSALYSGVFIILGALLTSHLLTEKLNSADIKEQLGLAALLGVFIASMVALKSTLVFFAVIYYAFFCAGLFAITQNKRRALLLGTSTALTATIAIAPWLLLHLPNYLTALSARLHPADAANQNGLSLPKGNVSALFSTHDLFWGGSLLGYGTIVLALTALGLLAAFLLFRSNPIRQRGCALVSAAACTAAVVSYFLGSLLFDLESAVRYACPVLIATLPFALLASGFNITNGFAPRPAGSLAWVGRAAIWSLSTVVIALFAANFSDRLGRAYKKHTTVSFPISDAYTQYNLYVLSEEARKVTLDIQNQTAAGAKILAWISMPLHLDFARNEIQIVMEPGLTNPWLDLPLSGDPADVVQYLRKHGIRYILWEYRGTGMKDQQEYEKELFSPFRQLAERSLYMRKMLTAVMTGGDFLYHQNGIVLFDLDQIN